jgi:competence protein ComEA
MTTRTLSLETCPTLWRMVLFLCTAMVPAHLLSACPVVAQVEDGRTADDTAGAVGPDEPGVVNINEASVEELMRLPGIGQRRAEAIIALRERLSGFKRLPQLMQVRGIGRKTFRRLRPWLALQGPTTFPRPPR